jgi:hypothetical protein
VGRDQPDRAGDNYGWPEHLGPDGDPEFVPPVLAFQDPIVLTGCAGSVADGGLFFGEGYTGNLHRMVLPGSGADDTTPVDEVVGMFDGGVTDVEQASDGSALGGHPDRAVSANRPDRGRLPLAVREAR